MACLSACSWTSTSSASSNSSISNAESNEKFYLPFFTRKTMFGNLPISCGSMILEEKKLIMQMVFNDLTPVRTSQPFIPGERTFSTAYSCCFVIRLCQPVTFTLSSR